MKVVVADTVAVGFAIVLLLTVPPVHEIVLLLEHPPVMLLLSCTVAVPQMEVGDAVAVTCKGVCVPGTVNVKVVVHGPACPL